MKESLPEQLVRLIQTGVLKPSVPESPPDAILPTGPLVKSDPVLSQPTHHELLVLENEKLRSDKAELEQQLMQHQAEYENLLRENTRLVDAASELPTREVIFNWRDQALEASQNEAKTRDEREQLARDRAQVDNDRKAFEDDLSRLEQLDVALKKLTADRKKLKSDEREALAVIEASQAREASLAKFERRQIAEADKLEKQAAVLAKLQAKIGHYKIIEKELTNLTEEHRKIQRSYEAGKTRVRNLIAEKDQLTFDTSEALRQVSRLDRDLKEALKKLAVMPSGELVIRSFDTIQWLTEQYDDPHELVVPKKLLLLGDGPWPLEDFTELLQGLGFEIWQNGCKADVEVVIAGRNNWAEIDIENQISEREGKSLRIYPQELFVLLLAMCADPFESADEETLLRFVEGHALFEYLFNQEFPWPESTYEDGPPLMLNAEGFNGEDAYSPLYQMGYSVAQNNGLQPGERHHALEKTFSEKQLPYCVSDEYMDGWGSAGSRRRLRRIAWHLHMLARRSRRTPRLNEAVVKWESDLLWLKKLYKPIHRFRWPT